jgi:hypothetical protein
MARNLLKGSGVASRFEVLAHLSWDRPALPRPLEIEPVKARRDTAGNAVEAAMKRLYDGTGKRFQGKDRARVLEDSRKFPPELRTELGALIDAVTEAYRMREAVVKGSSLKQGGAFEGKSKKTAALLREFLNRWWQPGLTTDPEMSRLAFGVETVDLNGIYAGAVPLARALDTAGLRLSHLPKLGSFHADWPTPLGRIAVGGYDDDVYEDAFALIVDLGGNDVYRGPGATSGQDAVSLVLDLGGDDRYAAADSALAGPGGAVLGYAGILDGGEGKDRYDATSWAGGFGCLGVGWIDDRGGDDTYTMQFLSEGCGLFGIGLLLDEAGNDQYRIATIDPAFLRGASQGFGGPLGAGSLIDLHGNDAFTESDSLAASSEDFQGYVQGASWGGESGWAGGLGWLLNGDGDDTYQATVHGQGIGVGSGLGVLADVSGRDVYESRLESQGCGEQLGIGILYDGAGQDRYRALGGAMGFGDDLGLGMLLEGSGDDAYSLVPDGGEPSLPTLASASRQGAGWLLDLEGNDAYPYLQGDVRSGSTLPWRAPVPGVSVLMDAGQPQSETTYLPCRGDGPARGGTLILPASAAGSAKGP